MSLGYLASEAQGVTMLRVSPAVWYDWPAPDVFCMFTSARRSLSCHLPTVYIHRILIPFSENSGLLSWWHISSSLLLFWTSSSLSSFVNGFIPPQQLFMPECLNQLQGFFLWLVVIDNLCQWALIDMNVLRKIWKSSLCGLSYFISLIWYFWKWLVKHMIMKNFAPLYLWRNFLPCPS